MKDWLKISLQLCVFGFFNGITPFSHFTFKFLTEFRGISAQDVSDFFLAQGTYWNLGLLAICFLITDMFRYKPLIILSALSSVLYYIIIRWTDGLYPLIACSALSGLGAATDVAYFTYIYAKVDREHYQQVTSNSRSAALLGRCLGATISQFLMIYEVVTVDKLLYISLSCKCAAFCIALTLPAVRTSIYFYQDRSKNRNQEESVHKKEDEGTNSTVNINPGKGDRSTDSDEDSVKFSWVNAKGLLWSHFKSGYSNKTVRMWSLWWALMQTGFRMAYTYNQPLWYFIEPERETLFNGFAEAGLTLFGALGALLAAKLNQKFVEKFAIWVMVACALGEGAVVMVTGRSSTVFLSYAMYIFVGAIYYFMVTVCSAIVAKNLVQDSFGLIFGINTWFALLFTLIFTVVVVSSNAFELNPKEQYTIYGSYFFVLAVGMTAIGVYKLMGQKKKKTVEH